MSAYNDYMVNVVNYFVGLADLYCSQLSQGLDDCITRNKLNIFAMYIDTLPRVGNENCLTTEEVSEITTYLNTIAGCSYWGNLTNINEISIPTGYTPVPVNSTVEPQAWNTTIGTTPTVIYFSQALGSSGSSWGMTYTAVNENSETVFVTITNRTASGFTATALEDNVHFEGTAILKTA